ncbi:hypothetical protein AB3N04_14530 [Alkalihalophilus sp. As8PL]|uniref:PH domain-containing protein n=1 Tax=Alkalihalophilus sp. As8PL TaxID=3237103 RepID=A0AB39BQY2_9BACI
MKTYIAQEPKLLWTILFFMAMTYAYALDGPSEYLAYVGMAVSLAALTTRYHLTVSEDTLSMKVKVVGVTLRHKKIEAKEISKVHQIIAGTKVIFIMSGNKGEEMKLHRFKPDSFEQEIERFVTHHQLTIKQTVTKPRKEE